MSAQPRSEVELDGQYRALREQAGAVVRAERRTIRVGGTEAGEYLQGQITNDVESLAPGEGRYAALLDRKGHMQGDLTVLRTEEGFWLETEEVAADAVLRHLSMYKVGRDVEVEDASAGRATLSVIGPAAGELTVGGPVGAEHSHRPLTIDGIETIAATTADGVDLLVGAAEASRLAAAIAARGIEPVSEEAAEIIRVESGRPRFGREMTTATIPQEAGINDRAVDFGKGCYIGQETVARLHYKGRPNRHLRGLRLGAAVASGAPVRLGERELGTIGTAVISPARGPIALAILRREGEPGAAVEVGDEATAEVIELPF